MSVPAPPDPGSDGRGDAGLPRPVVALLHRFLPREHANGVAGDLAEEASRRRGRVRRAAWLGRQLTSLLLWSLLDRVVRSSTVSLPIRRSAPLSSLLFELRGAARALRRSPGFSIAVVVILAVGVGGTSTVFALVHGVLMAPLPYPEPERLVAPWPSVSASKGLFQRIEDRAGSYEGLAAWSGSARVLDDPGGEPHLVAGPDVTAGFLEVLGHRPLHGRFFRAGDNAPGAAPVVVLSHGLWSRRFDADPDLVGGTIRIDEDPWTVIGVLPPGAQLLQPDAELVTPLRMDPTASDYARGYYLRMVGRLRADVGIDEASAEMRAIAAGVEDDIALTDEQLAAVRVQPLREFLVGDHRPVLGLLMAAVGLLLLIACVNAGNLMLARHLARRREVAVRAALGGGGTRALAFLAAESALLALAGGVGGIALAGAGLGLVRSRLEVPLPRLAEVQMSPSVLLFTLAATAGTALLAALVPALRARRLDPAAALGAGGRSSADRGTILARQGLVVVQVALAVVLMTGGGLMAHTLWNLGRVDPGFEPDSRLLVQLVPPRGEEVDAGALTAYYRRMAEAVAALPEVESAATVQAPPIRGGGWTMGTQIEGVPYESQAEHPITYWRVVSPGYFETLGARLLRGRPLRETDTAGSPPVTVVSETLARRHWPDADPLGKRLLIGWDSPEWLTVVGVVADVRHTGVDREPPATAYRPLAQGAVALAGVGVNTQTLVVHTRGDALAALPAVRATIRELDPSVALVSPASYREVLRSSLALPRMLLRVLAVFAGAALLLATVGISGIVAYLVRQRRREFGIRQALGARPGQIVASALRHGIGLGAAGLLLGSLAALGLGPTVSRFLFGVSPFDPVSLVGAVTVLGIAVLAASWIPSRRAGRVDPVESLRVD